MNERDKEHVARDALRAARQREYEQAWERWRKTGLDSDHSALAELFGGLVRSITMRYVRSQPAHVDADEYISAGNLGLTQALARFDPSHGAPLGAFVARRVNGAILDHMRGGERLSRADVVSRVKREEIAARMHQAGEAVSLLAIAEELGWTVERLDKFDDKVDRMTMAGSPIDTFDTLKTTIGLPEETLMASEERKEIGRALATLSHRERVMLLSAHVDGLTLQELGDEHGVSESRVSQINARSRKQLAAVLPDRRRYGRQ